MSSSVDPGRPDDHDGRGRDADGRGGGSPWRGVVLAALALLAGALTGTLPFVLLAVVVVGGVRWGRAAGASTVARVLTAAELQMTPAMGALGFASAPEGSGPRAPAPAVDAVVPRGTREARRRFVPHADLRPLEIALVSISGGLVGLRQRAVVTVAHELDDPAHAGAAATLLQASTLVPGGELPDTTRFACEGGWVVAAFDPLRSRDPATVAGALASSLTRIVGDAREVAGGSDGR